MCSFKVPKKPKFEPWIALLLLSETSSSVMFLRPQTRDPLRRLTLFGLLFIFRPYTCKHPLQQLFAGLRNIEPNLPLYVGDWWLATKHTVLKVVCELATNLPQRSAQLFL